MQLSNPHEDLPSSFSSSSPSPSSSSSQPPIPPITANTQEEQLSDAGSWDSDAVSVHHSDAPPPPPPPPPSDTADEARFWTESKRWLSHKSRTIYSAVTDTLSMSEVMRLLQQRLDIRFIAVMGLSGSGKSSLIKLLTRKDVYVSHGINSGTLAPTRTRAVCNALGERVLIPIPEPEGNIGTTTFAMYPATIDGRLYVFVDTPGFDDQTMSNAEVFKIVLQWFHSMTPYVDLFGLLYVHDISAPRATGSVMENIAMIKALAGKDFYENVCLVTTKWDTLSRAEQRKREKTTQRGLEEGPLKDLIDGGAKVYRHFGVDEDEGTEEEVLEARERAEEMIRYLRKCKRKAPQIQKELRAKIGIRETAAAKVLLERNPGARIEDGGVSEREKGKTVEEEEVVVVVDKAGKDKEKKKGREQQEQLEKEPESGQESRTDTALVVVKRPWPRQKAPPPKEPWWMALVKAMRTVLGI